RTAGPGRADGWTVFELAAGGDAGAGEIVERAGRMLGRIAAVLASMFDPERIVISGRVSPGMEQLLSTARPLLPAGVDLPAPELMVSRLGVDAVLIGAVASAAATARSHALDLWLAR
ncbi:ROK family protein, partial [Microbacterium sp.]|uniref:ROK family protein n=1 Tax=Microbacterium sp. TaxID=51671 RepID=UPI003C72B831